MSQSIINKLITIIVLISSLFRIDLGFGLNPTAKTVNLDDYQLVWQDEFEGTELDRSKWNDSQNVDTIHWGAVRTGGYWHKDMVSVSDGNLHIRTKYLDEEAVSGYGGDYKALLELEKRGREAFVSIGDEMSAGALEEYRRAFKAYFSETKAFLYRLSGSDDLAGIVYGHLGILQNVNRQYDRFAHLADKNERLARAIERALPSLAPSGADLPQILQERIVRGLLDEIPAEISKDMILARLFGGKEGI